MKKDKKAMSPIIATMLLIAIVIVLALIVFLWFRGITEEAVTKFEGTNVKLVCEDISFDASYSDGNVYILNTGNVPIYKMRLKSFTDGSHTTETITTNWPQYGLTLGGTYNGEISGNVTRIILIPVLIGHSKRGDVTYTCDERFGYEIEI